MVINIVQSLCNYTEDVMKQELTERINKFLIERDKLGTDIAGTCKKRHKCHHFYNKHFQECILCDLHKDDEEHSGGK